MADGSAIFEGEFQVKHVVASIRTQKILVQAQKELSNDVHSTKFNS